MEISFHPAKYLEGLVKKAAQNKSFENFDEKIKIADPRFGDFQANGALAYAKTAKANPRQIGQTLADEIKSLPEYDPELLEVSIAGAGFINFKFTPKFLGEYLAKFKNDADLKKAASSFYGGKKIVVDYPSPNTAKQMHVGHLRPMVIGEAISRLFRFCGANVVCDNHIGDWGTNFGILIYGIKSQNYKLDVENENSLEELEQMYKAGSAKAKQDPTCADAARTELVKLQNGDPENTKLWQDICKVSKAAFDRMYKALSITTDISLGESFYRDKVARVYGELTELNLAVQDQGALCVFFKDDPQFKDQPFIIRKSDGASNYASTDLACVLYRTEKLNADEIVYVTDGRQQDHFKQLFMTTNKWFSAKGYRIPELKHVWFGTILGEDGKAIKTKSGEPVRLKALIAEAVSRAEKVVREKNPDMTDSEITHIANTVGIAALRYSDLSQNRTSDYLFSWNKLLSFDGNTAPYLLYALARIYSIFRKANIDINSDFEKNAADLESEQEIALARKLLALPNVFEQALAELKPHYICGYLYELAGAFSTFYNTNKVIVDDVRTMNKRLMLCARTLEFMKTLLGLLPIEPLEKM